MKKIMRYGAFLILGLILGYLASFYLSIKTKKNEIIEDSEEIVKKDFLQDSLVLHRIYDKSTKNIKELLFKNMEGSLCGKHLIFQGKKYNKIYMYGEYSTKTNIKGKAEGFKWYDGAVKSHPMGLKFRNGTWVTFHGNYFPATVRKFKYGKRVGTWKAFNERGELVEESQY